MKEIINYNQKTSERLDKFVSSKFPDTSRRFFQNAIKNEKILVNDKKISSSYKLREGDKIKINIKKSPNVAIKVLPEKNINFEIIFEHPSFLIINKPSGISVHPSEKEISGTLVNGLLEKFPEIKNIGENYLRPGIVHRLDKETSGILIIAKNQTSFEFFKKIFQNREIKKNYLGWVWGYLKNKKGEVNAYIGKSNQNPIKQSVSHNPNKLINPKDALTYYKVIKEINNKSLIELKPKTGRKHQLRLHLHSLGHPIIGDKKYFNKFIKKDNQKYQRHLLHAQKIEFKFLDNKIYKFEARIKKDMML